ncbi:MAG: cytochrome b/b6 domain-containing protein [Hyphomicrobiaceae bacterium]
MSTSKQARVGVWDLPTRLFHWLLATLILCAWISFEYNETFGDSELVWHRYNGYAILVLVLWRLLWGVVGSPASRFANFLYWPWQALRYGVDLLRWREHHYLGHNPLGSYMIVALLALVATQGIFGLLATEHNSVTWGPLALLLSDETSLWFAKMHGWLFEDVLLIFIVLHIAANVLYRVVKKDQLIEAMVIGTKPVATYADQDVATTDAAADRRGTMVRALICLVLAMAIFAGAIIGLGGKLFY